MKKKSFSITALILIIAVGIMTLITLSWKSLIILNIEGALGTHIKIKETAGIDW